VLRSWLDRVDCRFSSAPRLRAASSHTWLTISTRRPGSCSSTGKPGAEGQTRDSSSPDPTARSYAASRTAVARLRHRLDTRARPIADVGVGRLCQWPAHAHDRPSARARRRVVVRVSAYNVPDERDRWRCSRVISVLSRPTNAESPALAGLSVSTATGIRTPVSAVRGRCPSPLDDGGASAARIAKGFAAARALDDAASGTWDRVSSSPIPCGCGGIGRRARFRSVWGIQIPVEVQVLSAA
jgi:hypothetical protein